MLLHALKTTFRIWKERAHMGKIYARHAENIRRYFEVVLYIEDGEYPDTIVYLREMGQRGYFNISLEHYQKYYVECSPWEAISSAA